MPDETFTFLFASDICACFFFFFCGGNAKFCKNKNLLEFSFLRKELAKYLISIAFVAKCVLQRFYRVFA